MEGKRAIFNLTTMIATYFCPTVCTCRYCLCWTHNKKSILAGLFHYYALHLLDTTDSYVHTYLCSSLMLSLKFGFVSAFASAVASVYICFNIIFCLPFFFFCGTSLFYWAHLNEYFQQTDWFTLFGQIRRIVSSHILRKSYF